jgi:hypothetical protein
MKMFLFLKLTQQVMDLQKLMAKQGKEKVTTTFFYSGMQTMMAALVTVGSGSTIFFQLKSHLSLKILLH